MKWNLHKHLIPRSLTVTPRSKHFPHFSGVNTGLKQVWQPAGVYLVATLFIFRAQPE